MNIKSGDRILAISHSDLDGCGTSIVIENAVKDMGVRLHHYPVRYPDIDSVLRTLNYDNYEHVIIMDISPTIDEELINISDKIKLLDHHETATKYHCPEKFRFVDTSMCATKLVKKYFEEEYKVDLSHLNDFVNVVNGYDLWIHDDPRSKLLNSLYYTYWHDKFRNRFLSGEIIFNDFELNFFKEQKIKFDDLFNNLITYDIEDIKGVFFTAGEFVNDICEKMLTVRDYDFVFCLNSRTKTTSVRTKRDDINVGKLFESMKIGGGHQKAGALNPRPSGDLQIVLEQITEEICKQITKGV